MTTERLSRLWMAGVAVVAAQLALSYALSPEQFRPDPPPLELFPRIFGNWDRSFDATIDPAALEILRPDDHLNRNYFGSDPENAVNLFIVYYSTQLRARNAHDPKVCLPGAGWEPRESRVIEVDVPDASGPLAANYYVIGKGDLEAVVLYWFQTHAGAVVTEQSLRFRRIWSAVRARRTDMALVRIVAPVSNGDRARAGDRAIEFAKRVYPVVVGYFPATVQEAGRTP